mmetsp:Transcript_67979/g.100875  ORF Transcript_67979/g.100875 Transcript_67979/m.100875 type:complete len:239 (-) Transcript_67979:603-1319(-)
MPNLAVQGMAIRHCEDRGYELLKRVEYAIQYNHGMCADGGARIEALLDAGADTTLRGKQGNTALLHLIEAKNFELCRILLVNDAPVSIVNDAGMSCVEAVQQHISSSLDDVLAQQRAEWNDFLQELKRREETEKKKTQARDQARTRANEEHRAQQQSLAEEQRRSSQNGNRAILRARGPLGDLEDGWGYFPSLAVLQFQSAIPEPPPSMAEGEMKAKKRLDLVLRFVGLVVFIYFLCS